MKKRYKKSKRKNKIGMRLLPVILAAGIAAGAAVCFFTADGGEKELPRNQAGEDIPKSELSYSVMADAESSEEVKAETEPSLDERAQKWAKEHLLTMTPEQKAAQMFLISPEALTGQSPVTVAKGATEEALEKYPVAGLIYFRQNIVSEEQLRELLQSTQAFAGQQTGIPLFLGVDEEGGEVARIANHPALTAENAGNMADVGASGDPEEAYRAGDMIGAYLADYGFNLDFAPVADVLTNEENTIVKKRSFGSDAELVRKMDEQFRKGLENHNVCSCLKHFPGHGATTGDTHKGYAYTEKTKEELTEREWVPFIGGIEADCPMIMVGHISAPNVTGDELPASLSKVMVTDILRNDLSYDGVVITDSMDMGAIADHYSAAEAAVMAVEAGADLILLQTDFQDAYNGLLSALEDGRLTEARLDESVMRILRLKYKMFVAEE